MPIHRAPPLSFQRARRAEALWLGGILIFLIGGCATVAVDQEAPLVTPAITDAAAARGFTGTDAQAGREVFLAKCGECHALQAPSAWTEDEWKDILPRMARRAKLDPDQARQVETYVLSAMDVAPKPAKSESSH